MPGGAATWVDVAALLRRNQEHFPSQVHLHYHRNVSFPSKDLDKPGSPVWAEAGRDGIVAAWDLTENPPRFDLPNRALLATSADRDLSNMTNESYFWHSQDWLIPALAEGGGGYPPRTTHP